GNGSIPGFSRLQRLAWSVAVCYVSDSGGNNSVVECDLAKVEVAGSNPVSRSNLRSHGLRASYGWRASLFLSRANCHAKVVHRSAEGAKVDGSPGRIGDRVVAHPASIGAVA